ncbi:MAG: nucleoside-triphosphatase, partial [Nitrososphaerales archaeon]
LRVGPKIGRYKVNLVDLSGIATKSILESLSIADLVVCDELGPMELLSPEFRRAVKTMIDSDRPIFCSIHKKLADPLITDLKNILSSELYLVDLSNRELLVPQISRSIIQSLGRK